jgi:hypothetical protein
MSTGTTVSLSSLATDVIARDVKCSGRMSFNRMNQEPGSTWRAAEAGGRRRNAGTFKRKGRPFTSEWEDRPRSHPSMLDASFRSRCSCVDRRSRASKSNDATGPEPLTSAPDPGGSPSCGLPMTRLWWPPTPRSDGSPSSGLRRKMPPEGGRPRPAFPFRRARTTATSARPTTSLPVPSPVEEVARRQ